MYLYVGITVWLFLLLLLGLRPESIPAAETWPGFSEDPQNRHYQIKIASLVFVTFFALWFMTAFRSSRIGNDTWKYLELFEELYPAGSPEVRTHEIGYRLLNLLVYKFTQSGHIFLVIVSIIMYGGVGLYIVKYSRNPVISLCLFFVWFFSPFTCMLRQGIAMVIALYGYQNLKNGKKITAAILFLLASTFHLTAFVCFLLFFDFKLFEKRWFVFVLAALCAVVSRLGVFRSAVEIIAPKYSHYFDSRYASSGWLAITYYLLVYAALYYLISRSIEEDNKSDRTVATNFALLVILIAFGYAVNLFDRVCEYFLLIGITEIPNMLYRGKVKHFRLCLFCICAGLLIMFNLIFIYRPYWNHIYPYEFWPDSIFAFLN